MSYEGRMQGATRIPSPDEIATARSKLSDCIAYLDAIGIGTIGDHASLALERLREAYEPGYNAADDLPTED